MTVLDPWGPEGTVQLCYAVTLQRMHRGRQAAARPIKHRYFREGCSSIAPNAGDCRHSVDLSCRCNTAYGSSNVAVWMTWDKARGCTVRQPHLGDKKPHGTESYTVVQLRHTSEQ